MDDERSDFEASLDELWPAHCDGAVFLTTYTFNAPFFDMHLLPVLRARKAHPIVVFVDRSEGYQSALGILPSLDGAGREYHLVPVDLEGFRAFHPKVHLFTSKGRALVGSGNLTPSGAGNNLEAFDTLSATQDGAAVAKVHAFFRKLLRAPGCGLSEATREDLLAWLPTERDPEPSGDAVFLTSLDGRLIDQLEEAVPGEVCSTSKFIAPFHDDDHDTAGELSGELKLQHAVIVADAATPPPSFSGLTAKRIAFDKDNPKRPLHAKVLHGVGDESSFLIVGSANITRPAWTSRKPNVEAIVVRWALEPARYDPFIDELTLTDEAWDPPRAKTKNDDKAPPKLTVRAAQVHGSSLTIEMDPVAGLSGWLKSGEGSETLCFESRDDRVLARLEQQPAQAAVLWLAAPGYANTGIHVDQPAILATAGRARSIRRVFQRIDAGLGEHTDRRELVTCLTEVLVSLRRSSLRETENKKHVQRRSPRKPTASDHDSDEAVIEGVVNLVAIRENRKRGRTSAIERIVGLVDAMVRRRKYLEQERLEDEHEEERNKEQAGPKKERTRKKGGRKGKRVADFDDNELFEAARKLFEDQKENILPQARRDHDGAIITYESTQHMLSKLQTEYPKKAATVAIWQIHWLESAWAVAEFPDPTTGWADPNDPPDPIEARRALLQAWESLLPALRDESMDTAHRVLLGIEDTTAPVAGAQLDRIRGHVTSGKKAQDLVGPIWELERANLIKQRNRSQQARDRYEAARARVLDIPSRTRARGYGVADDEGEKRLQQWDQAKDKGGHRVFLAPTGDYCPACQLSLRRGTIVRLRNASVIVRCVNCGVLLAHGLHVERHHD